MIPDRIRRDRLAERTVASSVVMRVLERVHMQIAAAAADSVVRRGGTAFFHTWRNRPRPERVRTAGWCVAVASATAIGLRALSARPEPLGWLLPAAVGAAAVLVSLLARPLAAAWDGRR